MTKHQGLDVPRLVLTQILPHGVFELSAVLYATSLGLYLSAGMGKKAVAAWRKKRGRRQGQPLPGSGPDELPRNLPGAGGRTRKPGPERRPLVRPRRPAASPHRRVHRGLHHTDPPLRPAKEIP